jgi:hypothetical protein
MAGWLQPDRFGRLGLVAFFICAANQARLRMVIAVVGECDQADAGCSGALAVCHS